MKKANEKKTQRMRNVRKREREVRAYFENEIIRRSVGSGVGEVAELR